MCSALAKVPDIRLQIYSPSKIDSTLLKRLEGAGTKHRKIASMVGEVFWGETWLPYWLSADKVDVFWSPAHRIPFLVGKTISVLTIHDLAWIYCPETMRPGGRILEQLKMPHSLRRANHVTAVSKSTANQLGKEFGIQEPDLSVVTPGVTHPIFEANADGLQAMDIKKPFILFVGTAEPRKNLERLLQAYAKLPDTLRDGFTLVLVGGEGWGGIDVNQLVAREKLEKHAKVLGRINDQELHLLYRDAEFLAMPSLYEGFGLPILEAYSVGTPVLTSNAPAMNEIAEQAGILVNPLSVHSITQGLQRLMESKKLRAELASQALSVTTQYSWENSALELISIMKKVAFDS
jgi:glycosyltransferase involved in cell wall biosynthesis